ncbi:hypothetical protein GGI43DRAFT_392397 [Trichoderma evansii]
MHAISYHTTSRAPKQSISPSQKSEFAPLDSKTSLPRLITRSAVIYSPLLLGIQSGSSAASAGVFLQHGLMRVSMKICYVGRGLAVVSICGFKIKVTSDDEGRKSMPITSAFH